MVWKFAHLTLHRTSGWSMSMLTSRSQQRSLRISTSRPPQSWYSYSVSNFSIKYCCMNMLVQKKSTTFLEHQSRTSVLLNSDDLSLYLLLKWLDFLKWLHFYVSETVEKASSREFSWQIFVFQPAAGFKSLEKAMSLID